MHKNNGFTLIELVVVIVLLGILAVVAAPKFIELKRESRISILSQVQASFKSVASLTHSKSIIKQFEDGTIDIDGNTIQIKGSYPTGHWNNTWRYALNIGKEIGYTPTNQTCTKNDLCGVGNQRNAPSLPIATTNRGLVLVWFEGMKLSDLCYSYYYNDELGDFPKTGMVTDGC
ncbi:type II secretion system protein [Colwellia sp. RSH04]|uniref:type II secretion system protein n=1 Tax=Colwellia sp. RSH04 TaxID=2305464 RepID=UPI000E57C6D8|nr:type II secretion system protein [Colwellia sp. RSH04]RHW76235.1 type II secretion system protein [Colwellia sp. RSH04]